MLCARRFVFSKYWKVIKVGGLTNFGLYDILHYLIFNEKEVAYVLFDRCNGGNASRDAR